MDIQAEKLRLIEWLAGLNDPNTLQELITLKKDTEADWWDEISAEERADIKEGMLQSENGQMIAHEEVMKKYKKWL
ncbi:hypothetical protein [Marinoscillum furvescens]|uniref:Uncharacterized protein n=1 Tax=Marinoscillum furvescens DSM 4134 TaxID=1122208 RepID=A0A3D9L0I7_MARFU|nr:hypothetical protein [Marinoscillum furvescens]RED96963.1 hypothetical protein C7460_11311 [Marinoscillum furvescens DSM 4134]